MLLVLTIFPAAVSADSISAEIVYSEGKTKYASGDEVVIIGEADAGRDLVVRIYDANESLVYTDVVPAYENEDGSYSFTDFIAPANKTGSDAEYTVIVTEAGNGNAAQTSFVVGKTTVSGGGGGGTTAVTEERKMVSWVPETSNDGETGVGWTGGDIPAPEDPRNPFGGNEELWREINKVTSVSGAQSTIKIITEATNKESLKYETARNNVAVAGEVMAANLSAKNASGYVSKTNTLSLNTSIITDGYISEHDSVIQAIEKAIADNKIELNREMKSEIVLNVKFDGNMIITITISKALVEKLENAAIDILTVKDLDFQISYTISELKEMLGDKNEVAVKIDKGGLNEESKKITVDFDTNTTKSVKIAFPGLEGDTKYMAIVDENGNSVGGRYNPATGVLEAKITESGVYQIVNNEIDFTDIKDKSEEMQESIKILAAKGIITGTSETEFSPDDTITRAEVAALLLRVLSQVDANADGGFVDVQKSDWFYGVAGSAKDYGMIQGFEDNTFRGREVIEKDQILTIAARILKKEMRYKTPENLNEWLQYEDADEIAEWARSEVALATMANIVTRSEDNTIHSDESMTRGDAALIIMRLFYKIW